MPKPVQNDELVVNNSAASNADRKKAARRLGKESPKEAKRDPDTIVYPEFSGGMKTGDDPLTASDCKKFLGWTVQKQDDGETVTHDTEGKPIKCVNNANNRPFDNSLADKLAQEILRGKWRINGETIIIGQKGSVLSGQHRMIGLIRAVELWSKDRDKYSEWETEPVIETMLAVGVSEDDAVVNTIDTGKTRSLSDVIYRSNYFGDVSNSDRKMLAKACDSAVKFFWDRTGVGDAYSIFRTHAEALDLLDRHKKLISCVKHCYEENVANRIGNLVGVGTASTLCYLMASCKTKHEKYYGADVRSEKNLDFSELDAAKEFWMELSKDKSKLQVVRDVLAEMQEAGGDAGVSFSERLALVIKAWQAGDAPKLSALRLKYHTDEDKVRHLEEFPILGGIDIGEDEPDEVILADEDEENDEQDGEDPTPEEIEERKTKIRSKGEAPSKKATKLPKDGDEVWVKDNPKEDAWFGTLISTKKGPSGTTVAKVRFQSNQKQYDVKYDCLSLENPNE
jgi:hypothetical protein